MTDRSAPAPNGKRTRSGPDLQSKPTPAPLPADQPPDDAADFLVVAVGASAGGLEACRKLLAALPEAATMAFIVVQHLDPTHSSMLVELLATSTALPVQQAADGMRLARRQVYVIPPGTYLSVDAGQLRLSDPQARHGARLPFDFLLHALAAGYGPRAVCVVLSGTGADGSLGLRSVAEQGGLVIAQDPAEAGYDGMPRNAILTGAVDLVLPAADIPAALVRRSQGAGPAADRSGPGPHEARHDGLAAIVDLLRTRTAHDFTLYKPGTLQRRVGRRMAIAGIRPAAMDQYRERLLNDPAELGLLAKDLLINVTSFFRDPKVFELLAETTIPQIVRDQPTDQPLRVWVAGCSTGEETYTLAMLFREAIGAADRPIKLQVFASDVDPGAVAAAREGAYPETITATVSPARLARFFAREPQGYRVLPELRALVVFTVQDVLADPPFSRLDLVSCRNLLIYLRPEAQAKVVALFHFALRAGGLLLLGTSETVGDPAGRFELISKPARLYRRVGRSPPGAFLVPRPPAGEPGGEQSRPRPPAGPAGPAARQGVLSELCRRLVIEGYAPASVLINRGNECLYTMGPIDRYLHVPPGHPTQDLLAMARPALRTRLRSAIQRAIREQARVVVAGGRGEAGAGAYSIAVQPVTDAADELLLVCFVDEPARPARRGGVAQQDAPRVAELEQDLEATRHELRDTVRKLEIAAEEQAAINQEAMSVNEEYQSTNEELLTSKEELQSLNEELTALNSQLQETLERQRTTSSDLQNVLYSTDVATLFLDTDLNIRFFTPATKSLFNVIPGDVGRPLADLHSLAADAALIGDARATLRSNAPVEREIEGPHGAWYVRRTLPYLAHDGRVDGVVITFTDVTVRKKAATALEAAREQADLANIAKSRFLAAASHDLRQPLQSLALIQGLLANVVEGERATKLVALLDPTLTAMSGMLNTLLDINQIDAGAVHVELASFAVEGLLRRLGEEFSYLARAQGLDLRVVACSVRVRSDPRLLEQMIRNLLSNALKYTAHGRVLLGCRRRAGALSIEVWDTGIGIPQEQIPAIFDEYHQVDNVARERGRGLGLGLSIVQRLGQLLGHRIRVQSRAGRGSGFAIEVPLAAADAPAGTAPPPPRAGARTAEETRRTGVILVIEDDPELRLLLTLLLEGEGHQPAAVADGAAALDLVVRAGTRPDLILADYNLPNGMDGLQLTARLREALQRHVPTIVLTGDIATATLRDIHLADCVQLSKPVKAGELAQIVRRLLPDPRSPATRPAAPAGGQAAPVIFVVDDDRNIRDAARLVLEDDGWAVEDFASCEAFLEAWHPGRDGCLLIDAYLPEMSGMALLQRLRDAGRMLPAIMITGNSDVKMAVAAMKAGAADFIEKPIGRGDLLEAVRRAIEQSRDAGKLSAWRETAARQVAELTPRQRQVMDLVLAGHPSKNIAADLGISQRTVENHRAAIMLKTGAVSLPALARLALTAGRATS